MENKKINEKLNIFTSNMKQMFDKVKKFITKKHPNYQELMNSLKDINEKIASEKEINVDNYFIYIKQFLESDNIKLLEAVLDHMLKLVKEDIFLGQTEDKNSDKNLEIKLNHFSWKRRYIDIFIDSIVKLYNIPDENILQICVNLLYSIVKNTETNVHHDSLIKILKFFTRVCISLKINSNIEYTKTTFCNIVNLIFNRMEHYNGVIIARESTISRGSNFSDFQTISDFERLLDSQNSTNQNTSPYNIHNNINQTNNYNSNILNQISLPKKNNLSNNTNISQRVSFNTNTNTNTAIEYRTSISFGTSNLFSDIGNNFNTNNLNTTINGNKISSQIKNNLNYRNPVDTMLKKVVTNLVDQVYLINNREEQIKEIKQELNREGYEKLKSEFSEFFDSYENSSFEKKNLLKPVPKNTEYLQKFDKFYEKIFLLDKKSQIEKNLPKGKFGWCYTCRNRADLYCKSTRLPICSISCKTKIAEEDEEIETYIKGEFLSDDDIALLYLNDSQNIFKYLCKLFTTNIDNSEANNLKVKLLGTEIIFSIFEKPGNVFLTNKHFIDIVKCDLIEGLLRSCMSNDTTIYSNSLKIFFKVWKYFREYLKQQIAVFIETVFLKILDSGNSTYQHKWLLLDNFYKLAGTAKFFVELYVNYDCDINEKDLLSRIVSSLSKISQGKYAKLEHSLSNLQEYQLRSRSLEVICMMIRSVLMFTQEQIGTQKKGLLIEANLENEINSGEENYNYDEMSILETSNNNNNTNNTNSSFINFGHENNIREKLDYNRKIKSDISTAVDKFNIKPKNGIMYLKKAGLINSENKDLEAFDIANFLKNTHGLNKENVGEFLGEHHELALKTLDYYTQTFEFNEMHIIESIREYLSGFRLPGESQKIDRIMEKFAAKYFSDNQRIFLIADCAYFLSFAIIMLQTDTHNPQVKNKMGIEGFKKMIKGINGGKDLDEEYIKDIYLQILERPISLIEHEEAKDKLQVGVKKKTDLFKKETERMYQEGQEKLKKKHAKIYLKICEIDYIELMLESIWTALLAMFSIILEDSEDTNMNNLCIEGFSNCIKLCSMLNLELQKEALIRAFCKLTNVIQCKEIKEKHINCIKGILHLAAFDGICLKGSWKIVLELISKIDYYHMTVSGSKAELENFLMEVRNKKKLLNIQNIDKEILMEKNNMEKISHDIYPDDYELIFSKTLKIDEEGLIDFVKSLCETSKEELASKDSPRIFSLQKLIETAELNIKRVRITWSQIWTIISEHLTQAGSNKSPNIAEKAIDSLRQLAKKLLLKEEISIYSFQTEFLKPFENILINNINSYRIKEYILTCVNSLVLTEASSIKSGWKIIFNIFSLASDKTQLELTRRTFDTILKIFNNYFTQIKDYFNELSHCVKRYSTIFPEECINIYKNSFEYLEDIQHVESLLLCLGFLIRDCRENIRNDSSNAFFIIIDEIAKNSVNDELDNNDTPINQKRKNSSGILNSNSKINLSNPNSGSMTFNNSLNFKERESINNCTIKNSNNISSIVTENYNSPYNVNNNNYYEGSQSLRNTIRIDYSKMPLGQNNISFNKFTSPFNPINPNSSPVINKIYNSKFWLNLYKNIFQPIMEDLISLKMSGTLEIFLMEFNEIYYKNFENLEFLLENYLQTLTDIISNDSESIALAGFEALKILIEKLSLNLTKKSNNNFWEKIIKTISIIFSKTLQEDLLNLDINKFQDEEFQNSYQDIVYKNVIYCIIQHNLIELCDYIIENYFHKITKEQLEILVNCLKNSWELAYRFNVEFNLRQLISFHFMRDLNNIAALFKQQQDGTYIFFKALNKSYKNSDSNLEDKISISNKIIIFSKKILRDFVERINYSTEQTYLYNENERLLNNMVPVILESIFKCLEKVEFLNIKENITEFTEIFLEMITCNVLEIRIKVKEVLTEIFKEYRNKKEIS